MVRLGPILTWAALAAAIVVPLSVAATSPLLEWRQPVYIVGGFAGVVAMALLLVQPLLAGNRLPGVPGRQVHRWVGGALVVAVVVHVAGLWITSPPDMIDALLFRSPTPFSAWGVIAMWALLAAALLAVVRRKMRLPLWRAAHTAAVTVVVAGSVVHAVLIDGTMGTGSKVGLCVLAVAALAWVVAERRAWAAQLRRRT